MKTEFGGVVLELVQGNISSQEGFEAVVNAANARLTSGGGVAGAIHRAGGPGLAKECASLAPISPGEAVITGGHDLANQFVIHCLGPVYGRDEPPDKLLASCYQSALLLAEKQEITSVAFPAISTGIFGYPVEDAAEVGLETVLSIMPGLRSVGKIRFVLFDRADLLIHRKVLLQQVQERRL